MNKPDCLIIGFGPCGIEAAIYLKRYGFNPIVVGKDGGALEKAHQIENYYGIESITGKELLEKGIEQAKHLGIEVVNDEVLAIETDEGFKVIGVHHIWQPKTILLAVGASRASLSSASAYEGKGVSYCAICDGFFYRKKKVAIIGNGAYMLHELEILKQMISDLVIFTDGKPLMVDVGDTKVIKDKILRFEGEGKLQNIVTEKESYPVEGCFIAIGSASGFTLAKHLGIAMKENSIMVNEQYMTNITGIFAGGDCIGGLLQVSKAIADGALAATEISKYLKKS